MPAAYPDWLRDVARELYEEYESCQKVAYVIELQHQWDVSHHWVWRVCREAGLIEKLTYSEAVEQRAEILAEEGLSAREVARRLQEAFPEEGRPGGPTDQWVLDNVDHDFAGSYERQGARLVDYERDDGTLVQIELRGRHDAETCFAVLSDYEDGAAPSDLTDEYDVPLATIENWTEAAGVTRTRSEAQAAYQVRQGKVSPLTRRRIVAREYKDGATVTELAERFDVNTESICRDLDEMNVERRSRRKTMLIKHWGSLQAYEEFCRDAYRMVHPKGLPKKAVCEKYDVSYHVVNRALDAWKKVRVSGKEPEEVFS